MTQAALDPRPSLGSSSERRTTQSWLSPAVSGAMLISLSFHSVPVIQAIRDLADVRNYVGEARAVMHDFLWATYEVIPPPPPPKAQEPEKPKEPEPEPEPAPAPAPKPVAQPQTKAETKPETKEQPPPATAQAGKTLTAADDVADFSNDFSMVQGDGQYRGGTTSSKGTATDAVRDPNAKEGGTPGAKGTGSAAPPPPPASTEPDRSRIARPRNTAWSCSHLFPAEADAEGIDNETVSIVVTVREDGSVKGVKLISDPGHGFGRAARTCALSQSFEAALDRTGKPIVGDTAPFRVRFTR